MAQGSFTALSPITGSGPQYSVSATLNRSCTACLIGQPLIDTTLAAGSLASSFRASFTETAFTHSPERNAPLTDMGTQNGEAVESDFTHCGISMFQTRAGTPLPTALALPGGVDASRQGAPMQKRADPLQARSPLPFTKPLGVSVKLEAGEHLLPGLRIQPLNRLLNLIRALPSPAKLTSRVAQILFSTPARPSGRPVSGASST